MTATSTDPAGSSWPSVAQVLLDVPLMHLDRPFDYAVPESMAATAVPGARVKVRFAGRRVGGFILDIVATSEHVGKLSPIDSVVSPEPVLAPQVAQMARRIADHYVGTVSDVLRLAIPPRHAKVEAEPAADGAGPFDLPVDGSDSWGDFAGGAWFLDGVVSKVPVRAVATAPPGRPWVDLVAHAVAIVRGGDADDAGRSVLVVVPDHRDVVELVNAVGERLPGRSITALTSDLGPAKRYRAWLGVRRGGSRVVIGTRAAMFAPVVDPALFVVWDDGDDLHAEPHAPYPHVREVLAMRSVVQECSFLVVGHVRTAEGERLVRSGWAKGLDADRAVVRDHGPLIRTVGSDAELARDPAAARSRIPGLALRTAREALDTGPVLVQVARAGYLPVVACEDCREVAICERCHGPLRILGTHEAPECGWCGAHRIDERCSACGGPSLRAVRTGSVRTAEELGRAFPGVKVMTSGREGVVARVSSKPALVVATPGAEPVADGGYSAVLLLDADALLRRADLRAHEEALRRWMNAVALVSPQHPVVVTGDPANAVVQALVRWDPVGFAGREFDERAAAHLPPAARIAALDGPPRAIEDLLGELSLPEGAEVLGPVAIPAAGHGGPPVADVDPRVRLIVRVPLAAGAALAVEIRRVQSLRSARKTPDHVVVRIDPLDLL